MSNDDAKDFGGVDYVLDDYLLEAFRLRMEVTLPPIDASTGTLLECLLDVRRRLDRVEELYANTLRIRGHLARRHTAVKHEADDAWDTAAVRMRQHGLRDEYSSAKERAAATNLEVLDLRQVERTADRKARECDEVVDVIRLRHRGLVDLRQDLLAIIRARQFESSLDR